MEEELVSPNYYLGRCLPNRLTALRRQNREKVSMVCDVTSRERSNLSIERTSSKLKLKKELSRGASLKLKQITEPELNPHPYQFKDEYGDRSKRESPGLFAGKMDKSQSRLPSIIRESPPQKLPSYKQILSRLIARPEPPRQAFDENLILSVQKSDQSGKSKSKSSRKMPRVVDVFQLYDRKKKMRCSREAVSNESAERSSEQHSKVANELQPCSETILQSPVLTVDDFEDSLKIMDELPLKSCEPIRSTLAKQLASISNNMEKFERLIVHVATVIPQLPMGKQLCIRIYENWGDRQFVGLNGVEFFNENGDKIIPSKLYCEPEEVPSQNSHDNRVENLVMGLPYHTSTANSCLMPVSNLSVNTITFTFENFVRLSMIRLWNYNCSATAAHCGAKTIEVKFDGTFIFVGGLQKANGRLHEYWRTCETLLFTNEQNLLKKISQNDWLNKLDYSQIDQASEDQLSTLNNSEGLRFTKGNETIELEVFENYGHPQVFRFVKISLFDCDGNELSFRIKQGRSKEYPMVARSIHLSILDSKPLQLITIKNTCDEKALKRIRLTIDNRRVYDARLNKLREEQNIYLSTSILYGPVITKQSMMWAKSVQFILRPQKNCLMVGINKLELYDHLGIPLLRSRQIRFRCNHPTNFDGGQLEPSSTDWICSESRLLIRVDFDDVVPLAAVCFFNYQQDPEKVTHTVHMFINEKAVWCGYLPTTFEQPVTSLFLTSCPSLQPRLARFTTNQQQFRQRVTRNNEGRIMPELPFS